MTMIIDHWRSACRGDGAARALVALAGEQVNLGTGCSADHIVGPGSGQAMPRPGSRPISREPGLARSLWVCMPAARLALVGERACQ